MLVLTCPNCNAALEISEDREFAFCQYCGTKIANISNTFKIDRKDEINNLIIRALEFQENHDYDRCEKYCNRILDLDPSNSVARRMLKLLPSQSQGPNVTILYNSSLDDKYKLRITLDGRHWNVLNKNDSLELDLPAGTHQIIFSGTKKYVYELRISNDNKKYTLLYKADRRKNSIDLL